MKVCFWIHVVLAFARFLVLACPKPNVPLLYSESYANLEPSSSQPSVLWMAIGRGQLVSAAHTRRFTNVLVVDLTLAIDGS